MKLVFCGTPLFAVPSLEQLVAAAFDVQLVVTQPDRPQGRGMEIAAPPVKQAAQKLGLPVLQFSASMGFCGEAQEPKAEALSPVRHNTEAKAAIQRLSTRLISEPPLVILVVLFTASSL